MSIASRSYKNTLKQKTMNIKIVKSISVLFFLFVFASNSMSQCSEVYFYRFNNIQCDKPIYLSQDGERIAVVKLGDRYKATICSPGNYTFVAKTNEDNISVIKTTIDVQEGQEYYVKIACAIGVELATITKKPKASGAKDLSKGSKFKGAVKDLNLKNAPVIAGNGNQGQITNSTTIRNSKGFQKSQVVGNFQFDIVGMIKAGSLLTLEYKITNLAADDRRLETCPYMISFYDDLGNLVFPEQTCIANSCFGHPSYQSPTKVSDKYYCNGGSSDILPSGIPINGKIIISGINKRATKFVRGVVWFRAENPFEVTYNNIEFPDVIDSNNPNRRVFGNNSLELFGVKRSGEDVISKFRFKNGSVEDAKISLQYISAFDDNGEKYTQKKYSVFDGTRKRQENHYGYNVESGREVHLEILFQKVPLNAQKFLRLDLSLSGYTFEWNDINIEGSRTTPTRQ